MMFASYQYFQAFLILSFLLPIFSNAHPCSESFQQETAKKGIVNCKKKTLGAEFGWKYSNYTRKLEILFGAKIDGEVGWLAWGLNPGKEPQMVGTRALIGIKLENSTLSDKYNITRYTKLGCQLLPSEIDLEVHNFSFSQGEATEFYMIHATLVLSSEYNDSSLNIVWQVGNAADGNRPITHPMNIHNFDSKETIDLIYGTVLSVETHKLHRLRKIHGILNIMGWGTLLPLGAIIARYFKKFPFQYPNWFCLHVSCQSLGYTLGTCGWILGMWLGNASNHSTFPTHRTLGIIIFTFTTLQMLALRLKPLRSDDYRVYWNMYHHFLGYSLFAIISVNIFLGISILSTRDHTWKWAYIGLLCLLGLTALLLEIFTWIKFWYIKNKEFFAKLLLLCLSNSNQAQGSTSGSKTVPQPDSCPCLASTSQPNADDEYENVVIKAEVLPVESEIEVGILS
ncbi:hypothetical protein ACH5RR_027863 [Cinchona calisaya]|uniref:Cytochrome b561 and DOMON domain-containing protein n=1 Tax=Cinchona calisaya TaxID=153742 RepID=A0ABD2YQC7_9GENT